MNLEATAVSAITIIIANFTQLCIQLLTVACNTDYCTAVANLLHG